MDARLVHKIYRSTAPGLPVAAYDDLSAFKIYLVDVGLLRRCLLYTSDAKFFQRLFLLGAQFPVAVLAVKDVPLMDVGRPLVQMERPV